MKALAQRYARALADVALERNQSEALKAELAGFAELLAGSADLRNFLASPAVAREKKHGIIHRLVERLGATSTLENFLRVLVDHRRAPLLPQIQLAFEAELLARQGVAEAQISSARELTGGEKEEIARALSQLTGKRIQARYDVEPELIGGAVARIGSTVYDGSVRRQLSSLRARLASE